MYLTWCIFILLYIFGTCVAVETEWVLFVCFSWSNVDAVLLVSCKILWFLIKTIISAVTYMWYTHRFLKLRCLTLSILDTHTHVIGSIYTRLGIIFMCTFYKVSYVSFDSPNYSRISVYDMWTSNVQVLLTKIYTKWCYFSYSLVGHTKLHPHICTWNPYLYPSKVINVSK